MLSPRRRRRVWPWVAVVVVGALIAASFLIRLPYYIESPGSVRATQPLVSISGHASYRSRGAVMYTTVSERRATPAWMVRAWLDDTIDYLPERVANPTGDRDAEERFEQQQMDRSKLDALRVAFGKLGIPIEERGSGALIQQVMKGFPAASDLHAGDVIVGVEGTEVSVVDDVRPLLADHRIGDKVAVDVRRKGTSHVDHLTLELGENEDDTSHGYLGVALQTADQDVKLPFRINLDSGSVIGPSAGLAWTLGVIDRLTPGDLTHGRKVAVTGTIDSEGNVGPIGGIAQKVEGAKQAGATLFLYPRSSTKADVRRMRSIANGDITLKPVATIDDALRILDPSGLGAA